MELYLNSFFVVSSSLGEELLNYVAPIPTYIFPQVAMLCLIQLIFSLCLSKGLYK